jgi:hypothetical protein
MMKKTVWYVCLSLLCCGSLALVVNAAGRQAARTGRSGISTVSRSATLNAAGRQAAGAQQSSASVVSPATPVKADVKNQALTKKQAPYEPGQNNANGTPAVARKAAPAPLVANKEDVPATSQEASMMATEESRHAWRAYARMQANGTVTAEEKDLIARYCFRSGQNSGRNPVDDTGGPDAFGYRFVDNNGDSATFSWIELRGDAGATFLSSWTSYDDGNCTTMQPIGFAFPFYGNNYSNFWVCSNGQIEFGATAYPFNYIACMPYASWGPAILAQMYDLHLQNGGIPSGNTVVGYKNFGNYTVIEYDSVGYWSCAGGSLKFEAILFDDGKVKLQYQNVNGTCTMGTVGIQDATGSTFLQYRCYSDGNGARPLSNGRAVWFYPGPQVPGRCCYNAGANCQDVTPTVCAGLNGTWTGGLTCNDNPCPQLPPNDNCVDVTPQPCPINTTGDNTLATQDCFELTAGEGQTWHAFTIDQASDVHVILCGDNGLWSDFYIWMETGCPCNGHVASDGWTFPAAGCIDAMWLCLPAGTYYYPVLRESATQTGGSYTIQINCTPCVIGRCCYNNNNNCIDNSQTQCQGLAGVWTEGLSCENDPCPPPLPAPPNDNCADAIVIPSFPYTDSGNNTAATNDCALTGWAEIWYTFTITSPCNLVVSECGSQLLPNPNSTIIITTGCPCSSDIFATNWENTSCGDNNWTIYYDNLPAGTYYYPIYSGVDSQGPYTVTFVCNTPPTGRCCYAGTCADDMFQPDCAALAGSWAEGGTCAETPCPVDASCMVGSTLSRLPDAANPNGYTSDVVFPYLVSDDYAVSAPITQIRFWGFNLFFNAGFAPCSPPEDPMGFNIMFSPDNGSGQPGAPVATFNPSLNRQETTIQLFGWPIYQYTYTLPTPVTLTSGWISIQGAGDPGCEFLWAVAPGTGASWQLYPDNTLNPLPYDMSICMVVQCDPATDFTVLRSTGPGNSVNLRWYATGVTGTYKVYRTANKNNDGDPNGGSDPDWTLIATLDAPAVPGFQTTSDTPLAAYYNYVVVHDCTPTGRCCYGDPLNPSCASPVGEEACIELEGTWTFGLNCTDDPCPIAPPNDNCQDVTPVPCPLNETGDNTLATHDCGELTIGEGETWHAFTLDQAEDVHVIECGDNGLWGDFYIVMEPGCPCPGYYFATNWTFPGPGCIDIFYQSLPAGTWYIPVLREAAYSSVGTYSIQVNCAAPPPPPANDNCGNAIQVFNNTPVNYDNTSSTDDGAWTCGAGGSDIWYSYTAVATGTVTVSLCGSSYDTAVMVLSSCGGSVLNCNDDSCGLQSQTTFAATNGVTYMIAVGGYGGSTGTGTLTVSQ